MNLDDETRTRLLVDMTLDADPTGSTLELNIDGAWFPCDWQGAANQSGGKWTQTGRTSGYFLGPAATGTGTALTVGRHSTQTRVTWPGGDTIVAPSTPIDVKTN